MVKLSTSLSIHPGEGLGEGGEEWGWGDGVYLAAIRKEKKKKKGHLAII